MFNCSQSLETANLEREILYWVERKIKKFVIWENQMFRRSTGYKLRTIAAISYRRLFMRTFYSNIGHWDFETCRQFILDCIWWPHCQKDILDYVNSCHGFQRHEPIPKYQTTPHLAISSIYECLSVLHWFCRTNSEYQHWKQIHINRFETLDSLVCCHSNKTCYSWCWN